MKKKVFMTVIISAAVVLSGCSQNKREPAPEQNVISFDSQPVVITPETSNDDPSGAIKEDTSDTSKDVASEMEKADSSDASKAVVSEPAKEDTSDTSKDNSDETEGVKATVRVNITYEDGSPDTIEYLDIEGIKEKPDETGHVITGYDESGKLIYKRSDSSVTDSKGAMDVEITYEFYSLDHDFDFRMEPVSPENGGGIQTVKGYVKTDGASRDFTFETVSRRGQTGIWYVGICSCRNGILGEYAGM
ncbi:MAG: hypothetical protein K6G27_08335 [Lachnospiraceae bacterium]|nr:hypothetical protein [Lachnospiraceae bacterium]